MKRLLLMLSLASLAGCTPDNTPLENTNGRIGVLYLGGASGAFSGHSSLRVYEVRDKARGKTYLLAVTNDVEAVSTTILDSWSEGTGL